MFQLPPPKARRLDRPTMLLMMGVSGVGKTTTGRRVAKALGWSFRDADDFHPPENVAKMSSGQPLTDADRWPWLAAIGNWLDLQRTIGGNAVVTCSALRRSYRTMLLHDRPDVKLVFLKGSKALIADRLSRRSGHFMPPALLESQFATLEEPRRDERALVVSVALPPRHVVADIVRYFDPDNPMLSANVPRPVRRSERRRP